MVNVDSHNKFRPAVFEDSACLTSLGEYVETVTSWNGIAKAVLVQNSRVVSGEI